MRLYIFIAVWDCTRLSSGWESDCQSHHLLLRPTHCCREQSLCHSMGRAPPKKCRQSPCYAPNEAEEMCRTIPFDFPTVQLAGTPAWFTTIPEDQHSRAPPTIRLHVKLILKLEMLILSSVVGWLKLCSRSYLHCCQELDERTTLTFMSVHYMWSLN